MERALWILLRNSDPPPGRYTLSGPGHLESIHREGALCHFPVILGTT